MPSVFLWLLWYVKITGMNILVVEDDETIGQGISAYMSSLGHNCILATDGEQGLIKFEQNDIDFVLLDIMLPKKSGIEILQSIRKTSDVPVLMLTALGDDETKVSVFKALADGFISKPFSLLVLATRIEAIYQRRYRSSTNFWQYKDCQIDFENYLAIMNGKKIKINPKELEVLKTLLDHKNQVMSRGQIIDKAWSFDEEIPLERVIDVYIKSLRKKLGLDCIVTVKNVGYKIEVK